MQCWGAPNSIYLQATLEPKILTLLNCYEIWAFIFVELRESNILAYLLKLFVGDILYFLLQIPIYENLTVRLILVNKYKLQ